MAAGRVGNEVSINLMEVVKPAIVDDTINGHKYQEKSLLALYNLCSETRLTLLDSKRIRWAGVFAKHILRLDAFGYSTDQMSQEEHRELAMRHFTSIGSQTNPNGMAMCTVIHSQPAGTLEVIPPSLTKIAVSRDANFRVVVQRSTAGSFTIPTRTGYIRPAEPNCIVAEGSSSVEGYAQKILRITGSLALWSSCCKKLPIVPICLALWRKSTLFVGGEECTMATSLSYFTYPNLHKLHTLHFVVLPGIPGCTHIAPLEIVCGGVMVGGVRCPRGILTVTEDSEIRGSRIDAWIYHESDEGDPSYLSVSSYSCIDESVKAVDVYGARIACITTFEGTDYLRIFSSYLPYKLGPTDHENLLSLCDRISLAETRYSYDPNYPVAVSVGLDDVVVFQTHTRITFDTQDHSPADL